MRSIICLLLIILLARCTPKTRVIVCDGNSITYGKEWGIPYPEQLAEEMPEATVYNKGVNSQQTKQMSADAVGDVDSLFEAGKKNTVVAWEITNDIYFNGDPVAAIDNLEAYCKERKVKGWKVLVLTTLPRLQKPLSGGTPEDYTRKLNEANTLLKERWKDFADDLVDVRNDVRLQDAANKQYFADSIHLTTEGMKIVAGMVRQHVSALDGNVR